MTEKTPILSQPTASAAPLGANPMPLPERIDGCPPGLEYLTQIDQLVIQQLIQMVEVLTGFEMENKYLIKNTMGQQIYFAGEQSDCCSRMCCGAQRPFSMSIVDNYQREVLHFERPFRCQGCLCPCSLQFMEIQGPDKSVLGYIHETWTCTVPEWSITDSNDVPQLVVRGPCYCCVPKWCSDVHYDILSADKSSVVGAFTSQWSGCFQECFTKAGNFNLSFPLDLAVQTKALLLGAGFLIDYMYYESRGGQKR